MTIDTGAARIFPPLARVEKFLSVADVLCYVRSSRSALAAGFGTLALLERLVPRSRLRVHSLQWHLKTYWSPGLDPPLLLVLLSREVGGSVLVDGAGPSSPGDSIRDTCSGSTPVLGCVLGVGHTPPRSVCVWGVVRGGEVTVHKFS